MSQRDFQELCESIATQINEQIPQFDGHQVRADAGSSGAIYVALRGARSDISAGERLADRLAPLIEGQIEGRNLDFAVSLGSGDEDLLLQIEVRGANCDSSH